MLRSHRADLCFGWLPKAAQAVGFPFDPPYAPASGSAVICNPIAWAQGTHAYLALRSAAGKPAIPADEDHLVGLWNEGLRVREAVLRCGSRQFLAKALDAYRTTSGAPSEAQIAIEISESIKDILKTSLGAIHRASAEPSVEVHSEAQVVFERMGEVLTTSGDANGTTPAVSSVESPLSSQSQTILAWVDKVFWDFCVPNKLCRDVMTYTRTEVYRIPGPPYWDPGWVSKLPFPPVAGELCWSSISGHWYLDEVNLSNNPKDPWFLKRVWSHICSNERSRDPLATCLERNLIALVNFIPADPLIPPMLKESPGPAAEWPPYFGRKLVYGLTYPDASKRGQELPGPIVLSGTAPPNQGIAALGRQAAQEPKWFQSRAEDYFEYVNNYKYRGPKPRSREEITMQLADIVAASDATIIKDQFPAYLKEFLKQSALSDPFWQWRQAAAAAWLSDGLYQWRSAPRSVEVHLSANVAESARVPTMGMLPSPTLPITSLEHLEQAMRTIIVNAPEDTVWSEIWGGKKPNAIPAPGGATPKFDRNFSWPKFLRRNLANAFLATLGRYDVQNDPLPANKGIAIVDETLKELAGVMGLMNINIPRIQA